MPKNQTTTTKTNERSSSSRKPTVITMGCPSGVGPEIALQAALTARASIIVGDGPSLRAAAQVLDIKPQVLDRLQHYHGESTWTGARLLQVGEPLAARHRRPGRPSQVGGRAQLEYIECGFALAKKLGLPLVTGPVSKEAIARSGLRRAKKFRGHTEWLQHMDGAPHSVMCFASPRLVTSLVTTHVPLAKVSRLLEPEGVERAILELSDLLLRLSLDKPTIAVCAFNPHAGEGELLGTEEKRAIVPGIRSARRRLRGRVGVQGPIGAETAYRLGAAGAFHGVVGIYHDQATIAMKLLDFGGAVNVTQGLSIVRTSVDHGTAYDIAGRGQASPTGMLAAQQLADRLSASRRQLKPPTARSR